MKRLLALCLIAAMTPAISVAEGAHNHGSHSGHVGNTMMPPPQALQQLNIVRNAIQRYQDIAVAKAEGWKAFGGDEPLMGQHWHLKDGPGEYISGDTLDYTRPSNLMYSEIDDRWVLTGVSFNVRIASGEPVPEGFAGRADIWHVHDFDKAMMAATEERPLLRWLANGWLDDNMRNDGRSSVAMVHAWVTIPNPDGPFANHNRVLPYLKLGLPVSHANDASMEAARGLTLATKDGCKRYYEGRLWIATATWRHKRTIRRACDAAAEIVRGVLNMDRLTINRVAEEQFRSMSQVYQSNLNPEQHARVAAMAEHGSGH
ncbi:MAG: hypothetical protein AAF557_16570 [Pseudomonadota bacterium]